MQLLIDGYNLLHATGAIKGGARVGELARARERLLRQLTAGLTDGERERTQIVFDSHRTAKGADDQRIHGMTVTYSVGFDEADDLLEQIIRQHPQPRSLTVISSDLRVQRTARARKAQVVSSDDWLMQLLDKSQRRQNMFQTSDPAHSDALTDNEGEQSHKRGQPDPLLSADEVSKWLSEFGLINGKEDGTPPT